MTIPSLPHSATRADCPAIGIRTTLKKRACSLIGRRFVPSATKGKTGHPFIRFGVSVTSAVPLATVGQRNTPDMRAPGSDTAGLRVNAVLTSNTKRPLQGAADCGEYREHGRISISVSGSVARPSLWDCPARALTPTIGRRVYLKTMKGLCVEPFDNFCAPRKRKPWRSLGLQGASRLRLSQGVDVTRKVKSAPVDHLHSRFPVVVTSIHHRKAWLCPKSLWSTP